MITPIQFIVNTISRTKVIIHDFPLYFNTYFRNSFFITWVSVIQVWLRGRMQASFPIASMIKLSLGIGFRPMDVLNIAAKFKLRSQNRMHLEQAFSILSDVLFQTKVRTFIRLAIDNLLKVTADFQVGLFLRMQTISHSFAVKMHVKSIVAIFYKNYERGHLTWNEIFTNENTWQKLLWREIK